MRGTATQQAAKRRQNLARGEASAASETLGSSYRKTRARFSGRQNILTLALLFVVFCPGCRRDSGGGISSGSGGWPQSSATPTEVSSSLEVVKVNTSPTAITKGGSADAMIHLTVSPGYHINANPATYPYLIATEIKLGNGEGITAEKPTYPAAKKQKFAFAEEPLDVYEGTVDIKLPLKAGLTATPGERSLPITGRVQACDTEKCFPPATINAMIPLSVKSQ